MRTVPAAGHPTKPHAVFIPFPTQGHIAPMLHLAKLLHSHSGFHITFVNTDYNHRHLVASRGAAALTAVPGFCFESIPDGLPDPVGHSTKDVPSLAHATMTTCLVPFQELLVRLNGDGAVPPVSCIVSDGAMSFTLDASRELGLPNVVFTTASACSRMVYFHYKHFIKKGIIPIKDARDLLSKDFMEASIDWIPGLKHMRFCDLPTFVRTTNPNDIMFNFVVHNSDRFALQASAIILNTFHDLEGQVLDAMSTTTAEDLLLESEQPLPPIYAVGPLPLLCANLLPSKEEDPDLAAIMANLWKNDHRCIQWLDTQATTVGLRSIVYVNFGSITVMTNEQLVQLAWGLAKSGRHFLWVIRPDLVRGEDAILPDEFLEETKDRGLIVGWCPQEEVLKNPAVGCFLTHCGWNSMLESISYGVPMLCWPVFADQQTNGRYACVEWGVAINLDRELCSNDISKLINEVLIGEKGSEIRRQAEEWRGKAVASTQKGGSSFANYQKVVSLLRQTKSETS